MLRNRLVRFGVLVLAVMAGSLSFAPASARAIDDPLARFEDPICPGIVGLEVESAEAMVWRIRENLAALGRRLAPPEACKANLLVEFVSDGRRAVDNLRRSDPWLFVDMDPEDRTRLFQETGPARAILQVVPRTRDGIVISRQDNLVDVPQATGWMAHSKIYSAVRTDIVSALIFLDRDVVQGRTIAQLADYVTFCALTRTLPQTSAARAASILALFDEGAALPAGLTEFDKAYLRELYSGMPNIPGPMRQLALEKATGIDIFPQ